MEISLSKLKKKLVNKVKLRKHNSPNAVSKTSESISINLVENDAENKIASITIESTNSVANNCIHFSNKKKSVLIVKLKEMFVWIKVKRINAVQKKRKSPNSIIPNISVISNSKDVKTEVNDEVKEVKTESEVSELEFAKQNYFDGIKPVILGGKEFYKKGFSILFSRIF